jgi:hypothetical protein
VDFPKSRKIEAKIFFKTKFIFSFGMLGRISTIIEIIVNCIVCEREIGILASSLAMGRLQRFIIMKIYDSVSLSTC